MGRWRQVDVVEPKAYPLVAVRHGKWPGLMIWIFFIYCSQKFRTNIFWIKSLEKIIKSLTGRGMLGIDAST